MPWLLKKGSSKKSKSPNGKESEENKPELQKEREGGRPLSATLHWPKDREKNQTAMPPKSVSMGDLSTTENKKRKSFKKFIKTVAHRGSLKKKSYDVTPGGESPDAETSSRQDTESTSGYSSSPGTQDWSMSTWSPESMDSIDEEEDISNDEDLSTKRNMKAFSVSQPALARTSHASTPPASTPLARTSLASTPLASTSLASTSLANIPLASKPSTFVRTANISDNKKEAGGSEEVLPEVQEKQFEMTQPKSFFLQAQSIPRKYLGRSLGNLATAVEEEEKAEQNQKAKSTATISPPAKTLEMGTQTTPERQSCEDVSTVRSLSPPRKISWKWQRRVRSASSITAPTIKCDDATVRGSTISMPQELEDSRSSDDISLGQPSAGEQHVEKAARISRPIFLPFGSPKKRGKVRLPVRAESPLIERRNKRGKKDLQLYTEDKKRPDPVLVLPAESFMYTGTGSIRRGRSYTYTPQSDTSRTSPFPTPTPPSPPPTKDRFFIIKFFIAIISCTPCMGFLRRA